MKMDSIFRIVTWNCRKAASSSGLWKYFLEIEPDVALLQEVNNIPNEVRSIYTYQMYKAAKRDGSPQRFNTAILVKGHISNKIFLPAPAVWIKEELQRFSGNLVALEILPDNGPPIKAVSVHGHDKAIDSTRFMEIDITGVCLTQNPDVWVIDLLWASLKYQRQALDQFWVVAGDFNVSETYDWRSKKPKGNREYLDRMANLGLTECLRQSQGRLTPTYRNTCGQAVIHQIDHLFVSPLLAEKLITCETGPSDRVFKTNLSDHLPIIADFQL